MTVGKRQGFIIINLRACMYIQSPPLLFASHPSHELSSSFLSSASCVFEFVFHASARCLAFPFQSSFFLPFLEVDGIQMEPRYSNISQSLLKFFFGSSKSFSDLSFFFFLLHFASVCRIQGVLYAIFS